MATHVSPELAVSMRQHASAELVSLSTDALEVNGFLHVGDDFAKVKLEELVKKSDVRCKGNAASDIADD